jgi:hypothetical protein
LGFLQETPYEPPPTNEAPFATISSPSDDSSYTEGESIIFLGSGDDAEDGTLTGNSLVWTSNIDGEIDTGTSFSRSDLSVGTHTITLTAIDSDGATGSASVSITVNPIGNTLPVATITNPSHDATFTEGEEITFTGTGTDPEDGELTGNYLVWTSDKDGQIGTGQTFTISSLSVNTHTITLKVTDYDDAVDTDYITISIMAIEQGLSILVDASRDGGVWWYPQIAPFDPDKPHQGKALADYLRSQGFFVTELPRTVYPRVLPPAPPPITPDLLSQFDLVIRANEFGAYTQEEIAAYHNYVENGGNLLLLSDYVRPDEEDSLGNSFGILFKGISRGENMIDRFQPHSITRGVSALPYGVGSGIIDFPSSANILGYLSEGTYLDLNDNGAQDGDEPTRAAALGEMAFGEGRIVFCGDTNMWLPVPQPLTDNTINWF